MDEQRKRMSRRQILKTGAGVAGGVVALATGIIPTLAQDDGRASLTNIGMISNSDHNDDDHHDSDDDAQWEDVEKALGDTEGTVEPDGVFKIDLPRTDLKMTIFGVPVKPDFAMDSEITFQGSGDNAVMKFELFLLDTEVNPFLSAWIKQDFQPKNELFTALHNHYLEASLHSKFLHGFATGNAVDMAKALYKALSKNTGTPFGHGQEPPGNPGFDVKEVEEIIGGTGELMNGILTVSVERKETIKERGITLKPSMGVESVFNFQSIGGGKVAVLGEFVVLKDEADPVARSQLDDKFLVTALHNHELDVQPQLYYLHTWATGDPNDLAHAIRDALNHTNSKFQ